MLNQGIPSISIQPHLRTWSVEPFRPRRGLGDFLGGSQATNGTTHPLKSLGASRNAAPRKMAGSPSNFHLIPPQKGYKKDIPISGGQQEDRITPVIKWTGRPPTQKNQTNHRPDSVQGVGTASPTWNLPEFPARNVGFPGPPREASIFLHREGNSYVMISKWYHNGGSSCQNNNMVPGPWLQDTPPIQQRPREKSAETRRWDSTSFTKQKTFKQGENNHDNMLIGVRAHTETAACH